ncbi:MAG: hypothetical protein IT266_03245 [Saprospiraceae bacterium]|nr:hypothetical protein [Saprospiraceae bacterium]
MKLKLLSITTLILAGGWSLSMFTPDRPACYSELVGHPEYIWSFPNARAYPPAVGILSNARNCLSCHDNNGPWKSENGLVLDLLDKDTRTSLKLSDGRFLVEVERGKPKTILTVAGYKRGGGLPLPYRNAWLYIDPSTIGSSSLLKFPPGWEVNLPMSCRIAGDELEGFEDYHITSLPMTLLATESADSASIELQLMLTRGELSKENALSEMEANYYERKIQLRIR